MHKKTIVVNLWSKPDANGEMQLLRSLKLTEDADTGYFIGEVPDMDGMSVEVFTNEHELADDFSTYSPPTMMKM